jgi:hypothetical protein
VITGTITDVDGAPAQGISVTAMTRRYFVGQGEWRYSSAGIPAGTTDDRGVYRIYGLPAGQYVVVAQPATRLIGNPGGGQEVRTVSDGVVAPRPLTMAQVFHPGVTAVSSAARISLRAGEERSGIDMPLQYLPLARVSGTVTLPPGWNPPILTLSRLDEVLGLEPIRTTRADTTGRFTFPAVPPGQYRAIARSTPAAPPTTPSAPFIEAPGDRMFAFADMTVEGEDVSGVALTAQAGLTIAGQVVFEGQNPPAGIPGRTTVPLVAQGNFAFPLPPISVDGNRFRTEGVFPGTYRFAGAMRGVRTPIGPWWLKSIVIGGRDVLDAPIDLQQSVDDAIATFSDRASELSGLVEAPAGVATDAWVIAAPTNRDAWFLNSRRIAAVHPDGEGHYTIRNLPPGDYRVIVTRDVDEGEWFDPTVLERLLPSGTAVTIAGVEKLTVNLKHP